MEPYARPAEDKEGDERADNDDRSHAPDGRAGSNPAGTIDEDDDRLSTTPIESNARDRFRHRRERRPSSSPAG